MRLQNLKTGLVITLFIITGCGGLVNDTNTLTFRSNLDNATVSVENQSCEMPCTLTFPTTGKPLLVKAEKNGYKTYTGSISTSVDGLSMTLDILGFMVSTSSGITSIVVDHSSGNLYRYSPQNYYIEFAGVNSTSMLGKEQLGFIAVYAHQLRFEAENGGGEYITTMAELVGSEEQTVIDMIKNTDDDLSLFESFAAKRKYAMK